MKQKHVAETADELLRMVAPVRSTSDPTPSVSGVLVLREHSFTFESANTLVEGVTLEQLLKAIAERLGFKAIRVQATDYGPSLNLEKPCRGIQWPKPWDDQPPKHWLEGPGLPGPGPMYSQHPAADRGRSE